jgi:alanine racemase
MGWKKPILLLEGFFQPEDLQLIDRYRLTTSVHSNWPSRLSRAKPSVVARLSQTRARP